MKNKTADEAGRKEEIKMKRIKKDLLPGVLREHYHGTRSTVDIDTIVNELSTRLEQERVTRRLREWVDNHYRRQYFCRWWEKQLANPAASIRVQIKIKAIRSTFENMKYGHVTYLASFLKQDKRTREVTFDFEKIRHI